MARQALLAAGSALVASSVMPLLFIGAEAIVQGDTIDADDFGFAYTLVAPFTLVTALAVAWPAWNLLPHAWSTGRRLAAAAALCSAVPVALLIPISDDFPWKGGLVGCVTLLIWAAAYHVGAAILTRRNSIRSNPSG
jgi:hypothetical protein